MWQHVFMVLMIVLRYGRCVDTVITRLQQHGLADCLSRHIMRSAPPSLSGLEKPNGLKISGKGDWIQQFLNCKREALHQLRMKIENGNNKHAGFFSGVFFYCQYKSSPFTNKAKVICKIIVGRANTVRPYKHAPTFLNVGADIIRPSNVSQKEKDIL